MKRREFIAGLGGAAAWPLVARAQQRAVPVIGNLDVGLPPLSATPFRQGLAEAGYVVGHNVMIDSRSANNNAELLRGLAADLVRQRPAVIVATGGPASALAAKAATSTIPIVFFYPGDPVKDGLVESLSRPGGNVTGVTTIGGQLAGKRLELLREMIPRATTVAYLSGPTISPIFEERKNEVLAAAPMLGLQILVLAERNVHFEATFVERHAEALIVGEFTILQNNRRNIIDLAARLKIPAIYPDRSYAVDGGLMSYDADRVAVLHQLGNYVGQILKGTKPANLPVQQPTRFELVINLVTAKALGIEVPPTLLALADEVIE
jgi:putative tryptophan/tyrosine transport system substrate-binding protein